MYYWYTPPSPDEGFNAATDDIWIISPNRIKSISNNNGNVTTEIGRRPTLESLRTMKIAVENNRQIIFGRSTKWNRRNAQIESLPSGVTYWFHFVDFNIDRSARNFGLYAVNIDVV